MKLSDIKRAGVAGGGTMGFGIAFNFAFWGYSTTIYDLNDEILEKSAQHVRKALDIFVTEGLTTRKRADQTFEHLIFTSDMAKLAANDFITECIVERLADKQELFNKLDKMCPPHTIIASNTSALLISEIGKGVKRKDKIVTTHYFDPPHIVPGVEIVKGSGTTDETFDITYDLMKKVGKVPIKVLKELPNHLLNTIQRAMGYAAIRLWAEGVASAEDIDLGIRASFGFRSPHEGAMMHADLNGSWRWPKDIRAIRAEQMMSSMPGLSEQAKEKLRKRYAEGGTWFIDPDRFEEAVEVRDREYARRLKELYWGRVD